MDLLRIAARVAAAPRVDPADVQRALGEALKRVRSGEKVVPLQGPPFDELLRDYEYGAELNVDEGGKKVRIFSMVHHDVDMVYEADLAYFDVDRAAQELAADADAAIDQFDEMFPPGSGP